MRPLLPDQYRDIVRRALAEDIGSGDVTTNATVRPDQRARGMFLAKSDCVLAGVDVALETFRQLEAGCSGGVRKADGDRVKSGESFGSVTGSARTLLVGGAHRAQFPSALIRYCDRRPAIRRRRRRPHHDPRHEKDDADAARAGEIRRRRGRSDQSSHGSLRCGAHQGQSHQPGRRRGARRGTGP